MSINEIHGKANVLGTLCKFCGHVSRSRVRRSGYGRLLPVTVPGLELFSSEKYASKML